MSKVLFDILNALKIQYDSLTNTGSDATVVTEYLILLYKMIGQTRDIIDGKGECSLTYMMIYTWYDFYPELDSQKIEAKKEEFRKSKFLIVDSTGFDNYYILRSNGLDTEEDTEFEVKENATTRGLVSAFSKYAGNRVNNRVILNRFIGLIS